MTHLRLTAALCLGLTATTANLQAISFTTTRSISATTVLNIHTAQAADIVVLGAGYEAGLRQGMVCQITRSGTLIGEILLVDLRPKATAALILNLENGQSIQPGDTASVKTIR
ncbi:hypothetical protein [Geminisphaera colitermitum]|uniref:hypothetical protein n=1 Tax=Geminisphaera colitermitum TaxID=1148786 RepID=UPI000158C9C1|nr:hypothetical protein [Geminisphaera colitermitum]